MKGVVFCLFEEFITESFGEEVFEEILDAADLKTQEPFVGPGGYPDEDLLELVAKAVERLDIPQSAALRAFGRHALPKLVSSHPEFADRSLSAKDFLLSVDSVIHVEVRKLFPDAETPEFSYEDPSPSELVMRYRSRRQLCPLVEGFVDGVSDTFQTKIEIEHPECTHEGAEVCAFHLTFGNGGS